MLTGSKTRRWFTALGLIVSSVFIKPAAADQSCLDESPLLDVLIPLSLPLNSGLEALGNWQLPVSPRHPEVLTAARLILSAENPLADEISVEVTFDDPQPLGLPFTFQRFELEELVGQSPIRSGMLDWSRDCTGPGRSIFPRQGFKDEFRWSQSTSRGHSSVFRMRLWGSRN